MPSESNFTDSSDPTTDPVAAWYVENTSSAPLSIPESDLPHNLDNFAFEGDLLFQGIFEPSLPSHVDSLAISRFLSTFCPEVPLDTSQGAVPNTSVSVRTSPGVPGTQPQNTATPPDNDIYPTPHDEIITGAELRSIGLKPPLSAPPIPPQVLPSPAVTAPPPSRTRVPQRDYCHGKKQWNFKRLNHVSFSVDGRPGINLRDALHKTFTGLDDRDDAVLTDSAGAISCRLLFPGYPDNGRSCQINALGWTRKRLPITRSKLAYQVAKKLERYLDSMTVRSHPGGISRTPLLKTEP
jgi:hypothetical protein